MATIATRVARLEAGLNSQKVPYIGEIWLVGVGPGGSRQLGEFLPLGRTEAERTKNRAAAYEEAGLIWIPSTN